MQIFLMSFQKGYFAAHGFIFVPFLISLTFSAVAFALNFCEYIFKKMKIVSAGIRSFDLLFLKTEIL